MNESIEVKLARLDENLKIIIKNNDIASTVRKEIYTKLDDLGKEILLLNNKVENIEDRFNRVEPTIEEFIEIKHKVVGAGTLGKYLWAIGGVLLGVAFSLREFIISWFSKM